MTASENLSGPQFGRVHGGDGGYLWENHMMPARLTEKFRPGGDTVRFPETTREGPPGDVFMDRLLGGVGKAETEQEPVTRPGETHQVPYSGSNKSRPDDAGSKAVGYLGSMRHERWDSGFPAGVVPPKTAEDRLVRPEARMRPKWGQGGAPPRRAKGFRARDFWHREDEP